MSPLANGAYALYNNISAFDNIATGEFALYSNTISNRNIANGKYALFSNVSGGENLATGTYTLYSNIIGSNNTGSFNVGIGINALNSNYSGERNTAVGTSALSGNNDSWNNTAIGYNAGYYYVNGWNDTFVGAEASATFTGCYNSIAVGNVAYVTAPNQARIGNYYTTSIGGYANWSNISDGRVKKNVKQDVPGLAFINKLNPVTYNLDLDAADKIMARPSAKDINGKPLTKHLTEKDISAHNAKQQVVYTGFVAQEVEKAAKELKYDFSGVDAAKNDQDLYALRYSDFVVPLVKAVQELSKENDDLKNDARLQQRINSDLQQRIEKLEAMMNVQSSGVSSSKQIVSVSDVVLQQNIPNPFARTTTINYILSQKYHSAKIVITDKSGKILKEMNATGNGKNSVVVDASTLSAGTYQYTLYADGHLISTKQMVLTK